MKILCLFLALMSTLALAQDKIYLYPSTEKRTIDGFDTEPPFIELFKAKGAANGTTILVVPGGGYHHLSTELEGSEIAEFYNKNGFDAWVLHYRLNNDDDQGHRFPDQYNDVTTAIRIVKSKAKDAGKVGIIGFSAGGHLSSMCATMQIEAEKDAKNTLQRFSSRPAFAMLIYPVIDMNSAIAHQGCRNNLLGKNADPKLADSLSTQKRVDKNTPPTFIIFSTDDDVVMVENGIVFYEALHKNNIPATIHIYDHGGHGYGLGKKDPVLESWPGLSIEWIRSLGLK